MEFRLHNKKIGSVFSLRQDENSATFALGWALSRCGELCKLLVKDLSGISPNLDQTVVRLQHRDSDQGYTDIEIIDEPEVHIIIEAKKLWQLPQTSQLERYSGRFSENSKKRLIVSLSAASQEYSAGRIPDSINGVCVIHRSWRDIQKLVLSSINSTKSIHDKFWLQELEKHLRGYVSMQDPKDNSVYVLSLSSNEIIPGSRYTWIDVIKKDNNYFHPLGINGWPAIPPNYIGFRYKGRLQSVHHIEKHEVVRNLQERNKLWPATDLDHFVYDLGAPMMPAKEMKNGNIHPQGRMWCAIDTLLSGTYATISDARNETKRRLVDSEV